jgi:thiol-disulfide isomerase/thioredoxin
MNIFKKNILIALCLFVFYVLFGIITYGDHSWMLFLILSTCFFISLYIFKNHKKIDAFKSILLLTAPILIIFLILIIIYGQYSRTILYIIFIPVSSLLAYFLAKFKHNIIILFSLVLFWVVGFVLFQNVMILIENKNAETNLRFPNVNFVDENKSHVDLNKNKIIILDFWSTSCSICFTKFPDLESTYLKYKKNPNVIIYTVNVPLRNDNFNRTTKILNKLGYTFPKIYATSAKEVEDSLKINTFPHLLILKNGRIRYNGLFESDKKVFFYNIESEIEKLLIEKQ